MKRTKTLGWLVMAAARKAGRASMRGIVGGAMMAAALALGMTACSGEKDLAEEPTTQPTAQTATKIHVTVGAGISDGDGQTRATVTETQYEDDYGQKKTRRTLTFTLPSGIEGQPDYSPGDRLYVWGEIEEDERTMGGLLTATSISDDGKSATFEGDLTVWVNDGGDWEEDKSGWASQQSGDPMTWYGTNTIEGTLIPAATAANAQIYSYDDNGNSYRFNHEYSLASGDGDLANKLMESAIHVCGYYSNSDQRFNLGCGDAIFNCTVSGLGINTPYYLRFGYAFSEADYNYWGPIECYTYAQPVTTDGNGTARFAIGTDKVVNGYWGFYLCTADDFQREYHEFFDCPIGLIAPIYPKVYNVKRNWTGTAFVAPQTINLSSVSGDVTLRNGDELKGELSGYHKISIAPGATVTLSWARIPGRNATDNDTQWAGITCLGDATIVLAEGTENYVKGYNRFYPGIQAGPAGATTAENTTLTISGTGTLTAETGMDTNQGYAAGIGGGYEETVGNIRIEGGNITARGNMGGAGIGSGMNLVRNLNMGCGDITITGGNITATGGDYAAGIGSGLNSNKNNANTCGDITIGGTATGTARGGLDSPNDIGAGKDGSCGEVSVAAGTISYTYYTVACTLKVTIIEDNGQLVSNKTCDNITISDGTRSVTLSGDNLRFDNLTKVATLNFSLRGPQTGATLTVTGTGGSLQSDTYSATISGVNIVDNGATIDLGEVNLVKQQ